jgi:hypothetical protein
MIAMSYAHRLVAAQLSKLPAVVSGILPWVELKPMPVCYQDFL